jgi:hypothetical protein
MANLLSNASATGDWVTLASGGDFVISVDGTFGGATVQIQLRSPDGSSALDIEDADFTAEGSVGITLPLNAVVRAEVSGGTPSALYASIGKAL